MRSVDPVGFPLGRISSLPTNGLFGHDFVTASETKKAQCFA